MKSKWSGLYWASALTASSVILVMLVRGMNTPLTFFEHARLGDADIIRDRLWDSDFDNEIDQRDENGDSLLLIATRNGDTELLTMLLGEFDSGPNQQDQNGYTPLHWAAFIGSESIAQKLLSKGADPAMKSKNGKTPADIAESVGFSELAQIITRNQQSTSREQVTGIDNDGR